MPKLTLLQGDALAMLKTLPSDSVHCCVTSPPYYGLRDYGTAQWEGGDAGCDHKQGRNGAGRADGIVDERGQRNRDGVGSMGGDCAKCGARCIDQQIGLERTLDDYLSRLVAVFGEVRRVLRCDGVCFVNIGDSYNAYNGNRGPAAGLNKNNHEIQPSLPTGAGLSETLLKPKDRLLVPFRLALALQADGWWVRDVICWAKRAPMPESVTDRCTQAWEPILMLTRSARYYYDSEAVKEATEPEAWHNSDFRRERNKEIHPSIGNGERDARNGTRNLRNFWLLSPEPYPPHFATMPTKIPKRCILAACPIGGTVLDPFTGSGTTLAVALELGRNAIGIELSEEYVKLAERRCATVTPGLALA